MSRIDHDRPLDTVSSDRLDADRLAADRPDLSDLERL